MKAYGRKLGFVELLWINMKLTFPLEYVDYVDAVLWMEEPKIQGQIVTLHYVTVRFMARSLKAPCS